MPRKRKPETNESKPEKSRKRKVVEPLPEPMTAPEPSASVQSVPFLKPKTEPEIKPVGLRCRRCNCGHFETIRTTPISHNRILRRRQCRYCGLRVTTVEKQL